MAVPTQRLTIQDPDFALGDIITFAAQLELAGERAWFEVWYPGTTDNDFDAVEVKDGVITTLPPYAELED